MRHTASSPHPRPKQQSTDVASRVRLCLLSPDNSSHTLGTKSKAASCGNTKTQTQTGLLLGAAHCGCAQSLFQRCSSFIEEFERILARQ